MYIALEFLSIFFVNTTSILTIWRLGEWANSWGYKRQVGEDMQFDPSTFENVIGENNQAPMLFALKQFFLSMRNGFIILIIYDAYNLVCWPFDFHEYAKIKNQLKRYGVMVCACLLFHAAHFAQIIIFLLGWAG